MTQALTATPRPFHLRSARRNRTQHPALEIALDRQDGADAVPHDRVVVGEEHRDGPACHWPIWPRRGAAAQGCEPPRAWGDSPPGSLAPTQWVHWSRAVLCPCARRVLRFAGLDPDTRPRVS